MRARACHNFLRWRELIARRCETHQLYQQQLVTSERGEEKKPRELGQRVTLSAEPLRHEGAAVSEPENIPLIYP